MVNEEISGGVKPAKPPDDELDKLRGVEPTPSNFDNEVHGDDPSTIPEAEADIPEVPCQLIEAFDARLIDHGDGNAEIRISHKGKDIVKTTIPGGILDAFFKRARELIENPIVEFADTKLGIGEKVVSVLRNEHGERVRYDPETGERLN